MQANRKKKKSDPEKSSRPPPRLRIKRGENSALPNSPQRKHTGAFAGKKACRDILQISAKFCTRLICFFLPSVDHGLRWCGFLFVPELSVQKAGDVEHEVRIRQKGKIPSEARYCTFSILSPHIGENSEKDVEIL